MSREYERQRKAAWRARNAERLKTERCAARERERIRQLPEDAYCCCCGETRPVLLAREDRCWNCQHAEQCFGLCPHAGFDTIG